MFLRSLLKPKPAAQAGERLYAATVLAARAPALYADLGAPDTADGRFEVYTLFVLLVLERLRRQGAKTSAIAQAYFDAYLGGLDNGLRELAVGDLSVGKTMRKLGEAFYGRGKALDAALAALPDQTAFVALVGRTIFSATPGADPAPLVARMLQIRAELADAPADALLAGDLPWREGA
ncbi:MAG TPA: ubiquinol-cytochrome C chaperone family protein [Caulobacteraceae bacterium]|jgi:cytochrome b pre-mRNA-processing protein 3|nr:ubiquinol-cytochrome C chaperone family protein [Caulobacteraceae bacterium]